MNVLRRIVIAVVSLVLLLGVVFGGAWALASENIGKRPSVAAVQDSPQWRDGRFLNKLARVDGPMSETLRQWFFGGGSDFASPSGAVPVQGRVRSDYDTPPASGLRVTWLGHSTTLIEIGGRRVLTDPMFSERASPFSFAGPKRFYAPPLAIAALPQIDAVVISHDHYDHLDMASVRALAARGTRFIVGLGVGARVRGWGVPSAQVTELDWWQSTTVGTLQITATPSRHFSGRWVHDANGTLWAGWALASPEHRVYYSGDTALLDDMLDIGSRLGPFDLAMIEIGEYDALWSDVHLGPEQAVRASRLVAARTMLPVHWATFDLALHGWTEPIERTLVAAATEGVKVATPPPGGMFEPTVTLPRSRWWPDVPWKGVQDAPAYSTGVAALLQRTRPTVP
ncbi:MAG TPA: MBL fold metallo-hydrolase [Gemmatimonas sp.]|nr:MBL fold metallo-hydrolase [Gemmatimonas sp.]